MFRVSIFLISLIFFSTVFAQSGNLYALASVWYNFGASSTPATLVQIDVTNNSTTELMEWTFENSTYIVGTAFDQVNMIYYFIHNQKVGTKEQSYISAINVQTLQFVINQVEISPNHLILWDIDIDSHGNIHYLARKSLPHNGRVIVDYCLWDPKVQKTHVIFPAATTLTNFGSVSYVESQETLLIVDSDDSVVTIAKNGYVSRIPSAVFSQGSIEWNNMTSTGYIMQWSENVQVSQYLPNTNVYPVVCIVQIASQSWGAVSSISDKSSLNPMNNYYSFIIEEAEGSSEPHEIDAVITLDLNSCAQYWVTYKRGHEVQLGGPEYVY